MVILVGGVSELYQGDLDLGRLVVERLVTEPLGPGQVLVEDLYYGAVAVCQRIDEVAPDALVLVGASRRGRPVGTVERRRVVPELADPAAFQEAVGDAVTGYVSVDLIVRVAEGLGALPFRTVAVEVEPARTEAAEPLSPEAAAALDAAVAAVRAEVRRLPLLQLADEAAVVAPPGARSDVEARVLAGLRRLDATGRWELTAGDARALRARLGGGNGATVAATDGGAGPWPALLAEFERLLPIETADAVSSPGVALPNSPSRRSPHSGADERRRQAPEGS